LLHTAQPEGLLLASVGPPSRTAAEQQTNRGFLIIHTNPGAFCQIAFHAVKAIIHNM
jgi:hypothetical protein